MQIKNGNSVVIVSSDSDFIQLLNAFESNLQIYNPVKKCFVDKPNYDYVTWKALRGDPTDNISGIRGIGDKTAQKICQNTEMLKEVLSNPEKREIFERNVHLIRLVDFSSRLDELEHHVGKKDFDTLKSAFEKMEFSSMLKESTWLKYCETFRSL